MGSTRTDAKGTLGIDRSRPRVAEPAPRDAVATEAGTGDAHTGRRSNRDRARTCGAGIPAATSAPASPRSPSTPRQAHEERERDGDRDRLHGSDGEEQHPGEEVAGIIEWSEDHDLEHQGHERTDEESGP